MDVNVSIGAGSAEIHLPANAAVTVSCTTGVGNCALPNGSGFWGQSYTSPEFSASENQINIHVSIGVGEVRVIQ
jgi:predicted membrane protein